MLTILDRKRPDFRTLLLNSDNSFNESLAAEIKIKKDRKLSLDEIRAWCRENISSYKIPDTFELQ